MKKLTIFIGVMGSGKDYQSQKLIKEKGFTQICFADELREMMWDLLGWAPSNNAEYDWFKSSTFGDYKTITNVITKEQVKEPFNTVTFSGRNLLQRFGTEVMRKRYPNFWVDAWKNKITHKDNIFRDICCSDLRFFNELQVALSLEGKRDLEFRFTNFKSERYCSDNEHESEKLAQLILAAGFKDGGIIPIPFLKGMIEGWEKF